MLLQVFWLCCVFISSGWANPYPIDPTVAKLFEGREKKKEKEEAISESEEAEERRKKDKFARVLVLDWPDNPIGHEDVTLQRNTKAAISRNEVLFLPGVDLYQSGREVRDRTLPPERQPARVPDSAIGEVIAAANSVAGIPYDAMLPNEWGLKAEELRQVSEKIWFVDRVELREPLFLLYLQLGNVSNNMNNNVAPFFERIGPQTVNYYWYLAAQLAHQEPGLMALVTDQSIYGYVDYYKNLLEDGVYPSMKVDFQMQDTFDKEGFEKQYEVFFNGLPVELDEQGQIDIFLGRTDIYLRRKDSGHGLSDRLDSDKTEDKSYGVREMARKAVMIDFVRQLFLNEMDCKPIVDDEFLTYLAIYAKLHADARDSIFVAVPKNGNPNKLWIWRFDPSDSSLILVADGNDAFPIHFTVGLGGGFLYNKASVTYQQGWLNSYGSNTAQQGNVSAPSSPLDSDFKGAYVPLYIDMRAHYNRFIANWGMELGFPGEVGREQSDNVGWAEYYQTGSHHFRDVPGGREVVTVLVEDPGCIKYTGSRNDQREYGEEVTDCKIKQEVLHTPRVNRSLYFGLGFGIQRGKIGRDIALGIGPRIVFRSAWVNVPHSWQMTMHPGWNFPINAIKGNQRVRPFIDLDARGGIVLLRHRSLIYDTWTTEDFTPGFANNGSPLQPRSDQRIGRVMPVFGLTAGIGTTF
ncbi:MAG: hypothetical protein VXZ96_18400 [Myxococcota bacterium]|nr:hypothetical protein [Myxococcota bacterium]